MTQYPNEKDGAYSNWVSPGQQQQQQYTSLDGAPSLPVDAPPDYGYAIKHPEIVLAPPPSNAVYGLPEGGPSSSAAPEGQETTSLGRFFGNKGSPPMWGRQPPPQLPYNAFPAMCLISNTPDLTKGFPELPPPCQLNPHPFSTHDVTEEDWKRFLVDVKKAASLTGGQRIKSNVIPMVTGVGFFSGFIMTHGIEKRMKYKNRQAAGDLVDHWNHYFFGPRRMEVVLCQASERLSGRIGAAPVGDPNQMRMARGLRQRSDSSSSSSSEDDRHGRGHSNDRYVGRRERRAEKRAARDERRQAKRDRKARGDDVQPYQLYITTV